MNPASFGGWKCGSVKLFISRLEHLKVFPALVLLFGMAYKNSPSVEAFDLRANEASHEDLAFCEFSAGPSPYAFVELEGKFGPLFFDFEERKKDPEHQCRMARRYSPIINRFQRQRGSFVQRDPSFQLPLNEFEDRTDCIGDLYRNDMRAGIAPAAAAHSGNNAALSVKKSSDIGCFSGRKSDPRAHSNSYGKLSLPQTGQDRGMRDKECGGDLPCRCTFCIKTHDLVPFALHQNFPLFCFSRGNTFPFEAPYNARSVYVEFSRQLACGMASEIHALDEAPFPFGKPVLLAGIPDADMMTPESVQYLASRPSESLRDFSRGKSVFVKTGRLGPFFRNEAPEFTRSPDGNFTPLETGNDICGIDSIFYRKTCCGFPTAIGFHNACPSFLRQRVVFERMTDFDAPPPKAGDDVSRIDAESRGNLSAGNAFSIEPHDFQPLGLIEPSLGMSAPDCNAFPAKAFKHAAYPKTKFSCGSACRMASFVKPDESGPFNGRESLAGIPRMGYDESSHAALQSRGWYWSGTAIRSSGCRSRFTLGSIAVLFNENRGSQWI